MEEVLHAAKQLGARLERFRDSPLYEGTTLHGMFDYWLITAPKGQRWVASRHPELVLGYFEGEPEAVQTAIQAVMNQVKEGLEPDPDELSKN